MSFTFAKEVMAMPLDQDEKHFAKLLAVKQSIASSVLTATVRVNQGSLKKATTDRLGALLDEIKAEG